MPARSFALSVTRTASIEAIGTSATFELAYSLLRQRGRPSVIGYSDEPVTLSAVRLMYYELEFVGSVEMVSTCRSST